MTGVGARLTAAAILALSVSCAPHTPVPRAPAPMEVPPTPPARDEQHAAVLADWRQTRQLAVWNTLDAQVAVTAFLERWDGRGVEAGDLAEATARLARLDAVLTPHPLQVSAEAAAPLPTPPPAGPPPRFERDLAYREGPALAPRRHDACEPPARSQAPVGLPATFLGRYWCDRGGGVQFAIYSGAEASALIVAFSPGREVVAVWDLAEVGDPEEIVASAGVLYARIRHSADESYVAAYDASTGALKWRSAAWRWVEAGPFFVGGWIVVSTYTAWDQRGLAVLSPGDGTTVGFTPGQDRVESLTIDEQGRLSVYGRYGRFVYAIE